MVIIPDIGIFTGALEFVPTTLGLFLHDLRKEAGAIRAALTNLNLKFMYSPVTD